MKTFLLWLMLTGTVMAAERPRFESYAVTNTFRGTPAPLDLTSHPRAREFRTRLREGAREKPDFAGFYTVVMWGCGSPCQQVALIDRRDGRVYFAPFETSLGGRFRLKSRLFVKDAPEDIAEYERDESTAPHLNFHSEYWLWDEKAKRFNLIFTTEPAPKSQPAGPKGRKQTTDKQVENKTKAKQ